MPVNYTKLHTVCQ